MDREKKRSFRRFLMRMILLTLVMEGALVAYAFLYRGKAERPTRSIVTNRDASTYTVKKQIDLLLRRNDIISYTLKDREAERDYGTYAVPGLKSTRTLITKQGDQTGICTSMTPQGLAVTEDYVLISAYCHTKRHNSVIYVMDRESRRFIKEIVLPGRPHVGGLAYDQEHRMLWYSSNTGALAQAVSISMDVLEEYSFNDSPRPISVHQVCSLYGIVRDSFMTFYDNCLYVGCFMKHSQSAIARYEVDSRGELINTMDEGLGMMFEMAVPLDYSIISEQAQGMAFYQDKLLLSHSYGPFPSKLVFYEKSDEQLYVDENSAVSYSFPEKMEQIFIDGDDMYVLFESAAYAYSASSINIVDRVLKLSLPKMEEYEAMR